MTSNTLQHIKSATANLKVLEKEKEQMEANLCTTCCLFPKADWSNCNNRACREQCGSCLYAELARGHCAFCRKSWPKLQLPAVSDSLSG